MHIKTSSSVLFTIKKHYFLQEFTISKIYFYWGHVFEYLKSISELFLKLKIPN